MTDDLKTAINRLIATCKEVCDEELTCSCYEPTGAITLCRKCCLCLDTAHLEKLLEDPVVTPVINPRQWHDDGPIKPRITG